MLNVDWSIQGVGTILSQKDGLGKNMLLITPIKDFH
jgi:hypothetical protein